MENAPEKEPRQQEEKRCEEQPKSSSQRDEEWKDDVLRLARQVLRSLSQPFIRRP